MQLPKRWLWVPLLILVSAAVWIALKTYHGRAPQDSDESSLAVLHRGLNGEPESLNPGNFSSNQSATVLRDIGEGLVIYLPDGSIGAGAAEDWDISADATSYRFTLRDAGVWPDGQPIVADDFVRSFRELVNPANAYSNARTLGPVKNARAILSGAEKLEALGVRSLSSRQLEIELESPAPHFLQLLTHPSTFPVQTNAGPEITNGPYLIQERVLGSHIQLMKNPAYWNADRIGYEIVRYHIVDELSEFNRFRAGELDITGNVPAGVFEIAQRDFPNALKVAPYLGIYYYGFNLRNETFQNNLGLRQALNLAVDRESLVNDVLGRGELAAYSWVPSGVSNYISAAFRWKSSSDEERAASARRAFNNSHNSQMPKSIRLIYNSSDVQQRIALAVQSMWQETLGIQVELENVEFGVLLDRIRTDPAVEIFRLSWTADYDDAEAFLQVFRSNHPSNFSGFASDQFDKILEQAAVETDIRRRAQLLKDAESLLLAEAPIVPLYFYVSKHLVADGVMGWTPNVLDIHQSQFLQPARP